MLVVLVLVVGVSECLYVSLKWPILEAALGRRESRTHPAPALCQFPKCLLPLLIICAVKSALLDQGSFVPSLGETLRLAKHHAVVSNL